METPFTKKELSQKGGPIKGIQFNKEILIEELQSLGHSKITPKIANLVGDDVEKEIRKRKVQFLTSELISDLVASKLEELGLIKDSRRKIVEEEKIKEGFHQIAEPLAKDLLSSEILDVISPNFTVPHNKPLNEDIRARKFPLQFSKLALKILEKDFCLKDERGNLIEDPEKLLSRVARAIAGAEVKYDPTVNLDDLEVEFYNLMASKAFLPEVLTLKNAGRPMGQIMSSFALPVSDSTESIFETMKQAVILRKKGGHVCFSFTHLRPKKDLIRSNSGLSSGPVSFMQVFELALETVSQGSDWNSADVGILNINHPDIDDFLEYLSQSDAGSHFNLSVGINDAFMKAVQEDSFYHLINPRSGKMMSQVRARKVFGKLIHQIWSHGKPNILFLDQINQSNPTPKEGKLDSVNADGSQPLLPYESCAQGSINLSSIVEVGKIDWDKLKKIVFQAVQFLDNVIEVNYYALPEVHQIVLKNRKISLGIIGWADCLLKLGLNYSSPEALLLAKKTMAFIQKEAEKASLLIASKRGNFPNFDDSRFHNQSYKRRNATLTTVSCSPLLAKLAGCLPGIEPIVNFNDELVWEGRVEPQSILSLVDQLASKSLLSNEQLEVIKQKGSLVEFENISHLVKELFSPAREIPIKQHLQMQLAFQGYTDNAVSKKIYIDSSTKEEEVAKIVFYASGIGLKGITFCGGQESERAKNAAKSLSLQLVSSDYGKPLTNDELLYGVTHKIETGCGVIYITLNKTNDDSLQIQTRTEEGNSCLASSLDALTQITILALETGADPKQVVDCLRNISCRKHSGEESKVSFAEGIANLLSQHFNPPVQLASTVEDKETDSPSETGNYFSPPGTASI